MVMEDVLDGKMSKYKYGLIFMTVMLCSCGMHIIDEKYAATVAKNALSLSDPVTAQELKEGRSRARLFIVASDDKKYVVRFLAHKSQEKFEQEINCLKIASNEGYGPHIYLADDKQAVVIMEFLVHQKISLEQRESNQLYVYLARLLQKIHHGQSYQEIHTVSDIKRMLHAEIRALKPKCPPAIPLAKMENIVTVIHQALAPHERLTPCHNDLHPNNLMFLGNEFKAIDYEDAAQSDPYFDIASVALFYCIDPMYERTLLATYLERQPTLQEKAKLYLAKQLMLITYALRSLRMVTGILGHYGELQVPQDQGWHAFLKKLLKEKGEGKLKNPEYNLEFAKMMINYVVSNAESQEFHDAINLLS